MSEKITECAFELQALIEKYGADLVLETFSTACESAADVSEMVLDVTSLRRNAPEKRWIDVQRCFESARVLVSEAERSSDGEVTLEGAMCVLSDA